MLAETVGWSTGAPALSSSTSISQSASRKRWRLRGSRTSSGAAGDDGAGATKNVSGGSSGGRGRGDIMSIHDAGPSARQACFTPTGTTPHAPGPSSTPRPSR